MAELQLVTMEDSQKEEESMALTTKKAYFKSLAEWNGQAATAQMLCSYMILYYISLHCQPVQEIRQVPVQPVVRRPSFPRFLVMDDLNQLHLVQRWGGIRMLVAPFWKRILAQFVDSIIIFMIKFAVAYVCFSYISKSSESEEDIIRKNLNEYGGVFHLYLDVTALSYKVLIIILLIKIIVCVYECLWITFNNGATPGKMLMKIRVLYVEAVLPWGIEFDDFIFHREPLYAILYPAETPLLMRSFFRAFAKSLPATIYFPFCVVMMFMKCNRTMYDIGTKTVVVVNHT